jgi:hypothetical protein
MKSRRDCDCPCHSGGVLLHVVPCCDGFIGYLKKTSKVGKTKKPKRRKNSKQPNYLHWMLINVFISGNIRNNRL